MSIDLVEKIRTESWMTSKKLPQRTVNNERHITCSHGHGLSGEVKRQIPHFRMIYATRATCHVVCQSAALW